LIKQRKEKKKIFWFVNLSNFAKINQSKTVINIKKSYQIKVKEKRSTVSSVDYSAIPGMKQIHLKLPV